MGGLELKWVLDKISEHNVLETQDTSLFKQNIVQAPMKTKNFQPNTTEYVKQDLEQDQKKVLKKLSIKTNDELDEKFFSAFGSNAPLTYALNAAKNFILPVLVFVGFTYAQQAAPVKFSNTLKNLTHVLALISTFCYSVYAQIKSKNKIREIIPDIDQYNELNKLVNSKRSTIF